MCCSSSLPSIRCVCVCHTSCDTLCISGCSDWCLCHSQWHNRNINVLCMEEFQLQDWPHCRYVNNRKVWITVRLMHFDCLLMHAFPCSANLKFCSMLMAFQFFTVFPQVVDCSTVLVLWVSSLYLAQVTLCLLLCSIVLTIWICLVI